MYTKTMGDTVHKVVDGVRVEENIYTSLGLG